MTKHATVDDLRKALAEGLVERMPGRVRVNKMPRDINGDPNDYLRFIVKGHEGRDAVAKFEPEQLRKWGHPPKFELLFPTHMPDSILLRAIPNANASGHGVFTITQKVLTRQGSTTLTWHGLRRKVPAGKAVGDSIFLPITLLEDEFMVINVSALERLSE